MKDTTTVCARPQNISQDLGEESVILDLDAGVYYGLNCVGSTVWRLIQTPRTFAELRDVVIAEYEIDAERCARDLRELLSTLERRGMIEIAQSA